MHIETLGRYQLVLSAMQSIQNGGWTAYAAVRTLTTQATEDADVLPYQRIESETLYASEAAAIESARSAALQAIASGARATPAGAM
ncbi:hypothetical protein [Paraburkholderia solisilvae]|uniref:Uncharacterized protein n=1 Tax=Paraburkholderia solisilvae TaxID=624376 RepID=A0A6J5DSE6_9BURK|nr:hypothetical protein [Paraburkholderia solisilvae]CAB3756002.1 hypothetical protein LMG29739_02357 [Paraburkholderia solisilvae]